MWNDDKFITIRFRRILIYVVAIIFSILMFFISFNFIIPDNATTEIYISAVAVLLTIIGFILSITNQLISKQLSTDIRTTIDTTVEKNDVIISCTVANVGLDRIENMDFYLFIDQPKLNTDKQLYEYKHVLKHGYDYRKRKYTPFCTLSDECTNGSLCEYPSWLRRSSQDDIYYGFKKLDFLSNSSAMYINSGEQFTEDISFNLRNGIYRAILIGRFGKKKKGCVCANKQFIISKSDQ